MIRKTTPLSSTGTHRVSGRYPEVGQKRGSGKCLPDSTQETSRKRGQVNPGAAANKTVSKQGFTPSIRELVALRWTASWDNLQRDN